MMHGLFQSFQSETKCFQAGKTKEREREREREKQRERERDTEEVGLKSSSFSCFFFLGISSSHWVELSQL